MATPTPTLHLAWTVDDGPTSFTDAMIDVFATTIPKKPIPATWFVQWDYLEQRPKYYGVYCRLQDDAGHEIGIHGASTIANHIHWFPTDKPGVAAFPDIGQALEGIDAFKHALEEKGILAKFVRAPTGLLSEVAAYLRKLGIKDAAQSQTIARQIIRGTAPATTKTTKVAVEKAIADVATLNARLPQLGLHLWGGDPSGRVSPQSWEA